MMKLFRIGWVAGLALLLVACGGDGAAETTAEAAATPAQPAGPSAADAEFAEITAAWPDQTFETCGRILRETLGTRELVQGALDGVNDQRGVASDEIEDATHWLTLGNEKYDGVRPRLQAGECDGAITLALDEAVQFFVKAGTAAVQAGQIAGS